MLPEVETDTIMNLIDTIGDVLVEMEVRDNKDAIRGLVEADFTNGHFARGFMLGATSILKCDGIPTFLTGAEARNLKIRVLAIAKQFRVFEHLEKKRAAGTGQEAGHA